MADANASSVTWPFIEKLEVSRWAEFTLWLIFIGLGVPGNLMIVGVCRARRVRTTTHVLIGALAMADLMICLLRFVDAIAIASVSQYLDYDPQGAVYFLSTGMLYTTALLTTAIAVDRYDAVCRSLRRTMTLRRAKIVAGFCFVAGFIGIIPEAAHKIHVTLHGGEVDTFIRSVFKFLPMSLYIVSLFLVALLYSAIFVFIRKRQVILAPDILTQQENVRVISGKRQQGDADSPVNHIGSSQGSQQNFAVGCNSGVNTAVSDAWTTSSPTVLVGNEGTTGPSDTRLPEPNIPGGNLQFSAPQQLQNSRLRPSIAQSRLTKMLFVATFMFFILWLPNVCFKIYALGSLFVDFLKSSHHANMVAALIVIRDVVYLNSVMNVFVYGVANKRFRDDCKTIIRKIRQRF